MRSASTTFHLLGFSMGAMTALRLRGPSAPTALETLVARRHQRREREPRASVARRLMDPARIERDDPAWARDLADRHDAVQGPGAWRRLLPAIAADIADAAAAHAGASSVAIDVPDPGRLRRPRPVRPGRPGLGADARSCPHGRLFVAPDCGHEVHDRAAATVYRGRRSTTFDREEADR